MAFFFGICFLLYFLKLSAGQGLCYPFYVDILNLILTVFDLTMTNHSTEEVGIVRSR